MSTLEDDKVNSKLNRDITTSEDLIDLLSDPSEDVRQARLSLAIHSLLSRVLDKIITQVNTELSRRSGGVSRRLSDTGDLRLCLRKESRERFENDPKMDFFDWVDIGDNLESTGITFFQSNKQLCPYHYALISALEYLEIDLVTWNAIFTLQEKSREELIKGGLPQVERSFTADIVDASNEIWYFNNEARLLLAETFERLG